MALKGIPHLMKNASTNKFDDEDASDYADNEMISFKEVN